MTRSLIASMCVLVCAGLAGRASACTTGALTIGWLADHSAQVVVCDVASIRAYWVDGNRRIESEVTLRNVELLKGAPDAPPREIRVTFPGGTVGDVTMRLCCAPELRVGDRYVMFLQPEYRTYPAAGLGQGMLRVVEDPEGVARVHTAQGLPVTELDERGTPRSTRERRQSAWGRARPVGERGDGVRLHDPAEPEDATDRAEAGPEPRAMTLQDFVARIRPALEASRRYEPGGPIARRVETDMTPVPLQGVDDASPRDAAHDQRLPERAERPRQAPLPAQREIQDGTGGTP